MCDILTFKQHSTRRKENCQVPATYNYSIAWMMNLRQF